MAEHRIAPPLVLVQQWIEFAGLVGINEHQLTDLANKASDWGYQRRCLEELSELGQEMQVDG